MAAQPPQASPVSQAHATYTHGQDAGDLAARARELGLERRAALLEASRQRHSLYGGTLKSTRLRLAVLASFAVLASLASFASLASRVPPRSTAHPSPSSRRPLSSASACER